ncbi:MAG TPA: hypothetical protein VN154_08500 [Rhizomicrobium sp.]|nr:hypothetical protein [Rhizomicrobium sp.]
MSSSRLTAFVIYFVAALGMALIAIVVLLSIADPCFQDVRNCHW